MGDGLLGIGVYIERVPYISLYLHGDISRLRVKLEGIGACRWVRSSYGMGCVDESTCEEVFDPFSLVFAFPGATFACCSQAAPSMVGYSYSLSYK